MLAYAKSLNNQYGFDVFGGSSVWLFDRKVIQKGVKDKAETRLAWLTDFLQIINRFYTDFGIQNQK